MALGFDTFDEFYSHFGTLPQEYFDNVIRSQAAGKNIPGEEAELKTAQAAVAAFGDQGAINAGSDTRKIQDLADAVNLAASLVEIIRTWKANKVSAQAFLDGKIPDARDFCGRQCQELAQAGWIDTTKVPA